MEATINTCPNCAILTARISQLEAELEGLKRMIFGKRSEKLPSVNKELKSKADPESAQRNRKKRRAARNELPETRHEHKVEDSARSCPKCGSCELKKVGEGKVSTIIELIPARLERQVHVQETLACPCGDYMVTAKGPIRPVEGGHYGAAFMANIVVGKCIDSMPLYRMEKQLKRAGLSISRSSLCNLFHQTAEALSPIYQRMLDLMPGYDLILADETPLPILAENKTHKGYVWAFLNDDYIMYRYSRTRHGDTASEVLKNSTGTLLADGFSGYNDSCSPEGRMRAGCWAHARRKFFEAKSTADEAELVLNKIKAIYRVEYAAADQNMQGCEKHLLLRKQRAGPIIKELEKYLEEQKDLHPPKSPMGKAITYAQNNWQELTRFLSDAKIPLDNNASERALRIIALGRKNYLFAGNDEAAQNLAGLYSLVASCELHNINPETYLKDVLIRVHTHPQNELDDLLPHRWKERFL